MCNKRGLKRVSESNEISKLEAKHWRKMRHIYDHTGKYSNIICCHWRNIYNTGSDYYIRKIALYLYRAM